MSNDHKTEAQIKWTSAQEPRSVTTGASAKESFGERIEINSRIDTYASAPPGVAYNYSMQIMEWRVD